MSERDDLIKRLLKLHRETDIYELAEAADALSRVCSELEAAYKNLKEIANDRDRWLREYQAVSQRALSRQPDVELIRRLRSGHDYGCAQMEGEHTANCDCSFVIRCEAADALSRSPDVEAVIEACAEALENRARQLAQLAGEHTFNPNIAELMSAAQSLRSLDRSQFAAPEVETVYLDAEGFSRDIKVRDAAPVAAPEGEKK